MNSDESWYLTSRTLAAVSADTCSAAISFWKVWFTSTLDATNTSLTTTGDTGVGITLAFNSVGWMPSNILFNAIDTLIGDPLISGAFDALRPAKVEAFIQNSTVDADGVLTLKAESTASITSLTSNETTSAASALYGATGMAVGGIIANNKVASSARAYIGEAHYASDDGTKWIETGERVEHGGVVYQYKGTSGAVDLDNGQQDYANTPAT